MPRNKSNNAGYVILELLKELMKRPLTSRELLKIVEKRTDCDYQKEAIGKYLNTLKFLNIPVHKRKDKFYIIKSLYPIELSVEDISVILFIKEYLDRMQCPMFKDDLEEAIEIIEENYSRNTLDLIKNSNIKMFNNSFELVEKDENIKLYEKFCAEKYKLEIFYKEECNEELKKYLVMPLRVNCKNGNAVIYVYCYDTNSHKEFLIENIVRVQQMPQKSMLQSSLSVTFKIKNRLANSYKLKKDEIVIEYGDDYKIISNSYEDKDLLLRRLLRYYNSCEILYPKSMREKMLTLIEEMEKIYV